MERVARQDARAHVDRFNVERHNRDYSRRVSRRRRDRGDGSVDDSRAPGKRKRLRRQTTR